MKVLLEFLTENSSLSFEYRKGILSLIKYSLSKINDGKYLEEFYSTPQRRNFVFAVGLPNCRFKNGKIELSENKFKVTFSTGDSRTGFILMSAFIAQKGKKFPATFGNSFKLESITQLPEKTVESNCALIKMYSPLCLREHNALDKKDYYYSVAHQNFQEVACKIISNQLKQVGFDEKQLSDFRIVPINAKKTVVTHYGCKIECSIGEFSVYADKAVMNYLLKYGIGSRVSAGFGFAELIAEGNKEVEDEI